MRLGEGTLENGDAKDIRDKHNVSMATSKWFSPQHHHTDHWNRSVEIDLSTPYQKKERGGGGGGWGRN